MIVTTDTLAKFGFNFDTDDSAILERVGDIIALYEKQYIDAVLSPELADVFNTSPELGRFEELRTGWIDDCHTRQLGLDYGVNYWCAFYIIQDGSFSMIDRAITTAKSENSVRLDQQFINSTYNASSNAGYECTRYILDNQTNFPEFTEAVNLGSRSNYNFR